MKKRSKFDSVFSKNLKAKKDIPVALMKYINREVPKGFIYKNIPDTDILSLRRKQNKSTNTLLDLNMKFPITFEKVVVKDPNELAEIIYRTQKPFSITRDILGYEPAKSLTGDEVIVSIEAPKFGGIDPLTVEINSEEIIVPMQRVPYASLTEIAIESAPTFPLKIRILIKEQSKAVRIKIDLNKEFIKTVDDYFVNYEMIKLFCNNEISVLGNIIPMFDTVDSFRRTDQLCQALKKIQEYTNAVFPFPYEIPGEEFASVKCLFESLVNDRVTKRRIPKGSVLSLTFNREEKKVEDLVKQVTNLSSFFINEVKEIEILNTKLPVNEYVFYEARNLKRTDVENNRLELESTEKSFNYTYYQLADNDVKIYSANEFVEKIQEFINIDDINFEVLSNKI